MKKDKYDLAIEYLTENPQDILRAWGMPIPGTPLEIANAHCLFQFATPTGEAEYGTPCGCLTQIKGTHRTACTLELTQEIRADKRIPNAPLAIRTEDLPVFAEWQRKLDKVLNRT